MAPPGPQYEPIKKVSIICSKGSLDMAYPGLILANAARMSGIDATLFFTFWGMDIITKKKIDHLAVTPLGNPSMGMPAMLGGLPGLQWMATTMMKKTIDQLDIPPMPEMIARYAAAIEENIARAERSGQKYVSHVVSDSMRTTASNRKVIAESIEGYNERIAKAWARERIAKDGGA